MIIDPTQPLIWTTKGNVPVKSTTYTTEWQVSENSIVFIERFHIGAELVRQNVHVNVLKGEAVLPAQAQL